ncbi:MAG: 4Fe-4S dicluster domain-containing protein [Desulfobacterales bacterium]
MKKLFGTLVRPRLEYSLLDHRPSAPQSMPTSKTLTLLYDRPFDSSGVADTALLHRGDTIRTGEKLILFEGDPTPLISPVTGTITTLSPFTGDFGRQYTAIRVDAAKEDVFDNQFEAASKDPTLATALTYLTQVPGRPPLELFTDPEKPIDTIVVYGLDSDLFSTTHQYALTANPTAVRDGIGILKKITGVENVTIVVPRHFVHGFGDMGADMKAVDTHYPSTHPFLIARNVLGRTVSAGKTCEDLGIAFFSAEAMASLGQAFTTGKIPHIKTLTLATKEGVSRLVSVRIGSPVADILTETGITLNEQDRIIFGGPMTGSAIYSLDQPIQPDTDVIFLQDRDDIPQSADTPCINCGECVQVCPVLIPVNMLVRFLGVGQYEEAADQYDLHACIECGFCSYVCVSKIPISQYIRLAKYELARMQETEMETEETDA